MGGEGPKRERCGRGRGREGDSTWIVFLGVISRRGCESSLDFVFFSRVRGCSLFVFVFVCVCPSMHCPFMYFMFSLSKEVQDSQFIVEIRHKNHLISLARPPWTAPPVMRNLFVTIHFTGNTICSK